MLKGEFVLVVIVRDGKITIDRDAILILKAAHVLLERILNGLNAIFVIVHFDLLLVDGVAMNLNPRAGAVVSAHGEIDVGLAGLDERSAEFVALTVDHPLPRHSPSAEALVRVLGVSLTDRGAVALALDVGGHVIGHFTISLVRCLVRLVLRQP